MRKKVLSFVAAALLAAAVAMPAWGEAPAPDPIRTIGLGRLSRAAISADGSQIATCGDGGARVWDAATYTVIATYSGGWEYTGRVAFSPDGTRLAIAGETDTEELEYGGVMVFDLETGNTVFDTTVTDGWIRDIAFSAVGSRFMAIMAGGDDFARVYDTSDWSVINDVYPSGYWGLDEAALSPDGTKVLMSGGVYSGDPSFTLYSVDTGDTLRTFPELPPGLPDEVDSMAFSADGALIVTGYENGTVEIWNAASGASVRTIDAHEAYVDGVAFSPPDGSRILSFSSENCALWDAGSGEPVRIVVGPEHETNSAVFSSDGAQILTAGEDGTARLWSVATGDNTDTFFGHAEANSLAYSPDGTQLLTSGGTSAYLWDVATGDMISGFLGHTDDVEGAVFSPDGSEIFTGSSDGTVKRWDASTGNNLSTFDAQPEGVESIALSPGGTEILTGGNWENPSVMLWDAITGEPLHTFTGHTDSVEALAFSPDGTLAVSADSLYESPAPIVWNLVAKEQKFTLPGHTDMVQAVAFSSDSAQILTGSGWDDGTAKLWNAANGELVRSFDHGENVDSVAFMPSGTEILTAGNGGVKLFDLASGNFLRTVAPAALDFDAAAPSPDGQTIATDGDDLGTTAAIWLVSPQVLAVNSMPDGIPITGDAPGTTNYTTTLETDSVVTLTAPESIREGELNFAGWLVDGQAVTTLSVEITMDSHKTVQVIFAPEMPPKLVGDTNDDCVLNILDMIYVRNHLNEGCSDR